MAKTKGGEIAKRIILHKIKKVNKLLQKISSQLETIENIIDYTEIKVPKEDING